jgi:hypothetical protein
MRPIPHRTDEADEEDDSESDDQLTREEAMAGEAEWLEIQEF